MIDLDEDEPMQRPRFTWTKQVGDVLLAGIAVGFVVLAVNVVLRFHWTPRLVEVENGIALHYPWRAIGVIAGIGVVLIVAGLRMGLDRQYYHWLFVAAGVALLTFGTGFAARERVAITSDELAIRRWWGLERHAWRYDDLNSIAVVEHQVRTRRVPGWWVSVRCEVKEADGSVHVEEVAAPRVLGAAQLPLFTHAKAKGVAVGWTPAPAR